MNGKLEISDEDIAQAEKSILDVGRHFDKEERIPIIRCMDKSINVIACPGSGKTTALLAKLSTLENHLPLEQSKGVCVLTHTNVAVNEIKDRCKRQIAHT